MISMRGGLCFRRRGERAQLPAPDTTGLAPGLAQALADTLPFLLCGEESAVHAFSRRRGATLDHAALESIALDEAQHAAWLEALARALPVAHSAVAGEQMAGFFRALLTRDAARHFASIAALDLAVCRLLRPLVAPGSALTAAPAVLAGLRRIQRDEARHVRVARDCARQLGVDAAQQRRLDVGLQQRLFALLAPVQASLTRLGVRGLEVAACQ